MPVDASEEQALDRKLTTSDLDSIRGKEAFYYILNAILYLLCPVCNKIFKEATTDNFIFICRQQRLRPTTRTRAGGSATSRTRSSLDPTGVSSALRRYLPFARS
jgi:hypothetical protein